MSNLIHSLAPAAVLECCTLVFACHVTTTVALGTLMSQASFALVVSVLYDRIYVDIAMLTIMRCFNSCIKVNSCLGARILSHSVIG